MPTPKQIKYWKSKVGKPPTEKQLLYYESKKGKPSWNKNKKMADYPQCGFKKGHKDFVPVVSRKKSGEKISKSNKGEKGSNWRGGLTSKNKSARNSVEFRLWREAVFARDGWVCQRCNVKGGYLHPHHILNFSEHTELRFAIDNGITLCERCHRNFHKKYGVTKNNKEQIYEYRFK
jgi:hypothetical protein